ncbi:class I SAM-dependent methyltransferase [Candidatus Methylacidiphilum infernorum]|uniref:Class I SAM-dependent methyltransferase n=1 Tax=Candidatus Methylacidiphilum infernorum TaxID=511746 RepID=A0ABX7PXA3_9BACT|nr:class I SAM-dependent methyltransferase [Candidatus Methylacidiphilum infernorum]QSR87286.1 class I SAM-dependent methyltransferase [Candidatus Methylacidiphilum infernorum]
MQKSFIQLYLEHKEKIAHKWTSYLKIYDFAFSPFRNLPINLLEIGVQNGGSLEIWSKYFENALKIVGCDINPRCKELFFSDPKIRIVIGDSCREETKNKILAETSSYNLIIDDGSHKSSDIIKNFALYFPHLANKGIYLIEDLHCSYWKEFEGGLFYPYSAMGFFKKLVDIINYQHWAVAKERKELLKEFEKLYDINIGNDTLSQIYKIEFFNSVCMITKSIEEENSIGKPIVAGTKAEISPGIKDSEGAVFFPDQKENFWSNETSFESLEEKLIQKLAEKEKEIERIKNSFSWKLIQPIQYFLQKILKNSASNHQ